MSNNPQPKTLAEVRSEIMQRVWGVRTERGVGLPNVIFVTKREQVKGIPEAEKAFAHFNW